MVAHNKPDTSDEQLEHIMRLAKARASHRLAHEQSDS
jgi:hypothetical protein